MNQIQTIEPQVTIALDRYKDLLEKEEKLRGLTTAVESVISDLVEILP